MKGEEKVTNQKNSSTCHLRRLWVGGSPAGTGVAATALEFGLELEVSGRRKRIHSFSKL
jgi:hypothetical protein